MVIVQVIVHGQTCPSFASKVINQQMSINANVKSTTKLELLQILQSTVESYHRFVPLRLLVQSKFHLRFKMHRSFFL